MRGSGRGDAPADVVEHRADLLGRETARALLELGRDRLGATLGATFVLHTWARDLTFHPHVHASRGQGQQALLERLCEGAARQRQARRRLSRALHPSRRHRQQSPARGHRRARRLPHPRQRHRDRHPGRVPPALRAARPARGLPQDPPRRPLCLPREAQRCPRAPRHGTADPNAARLMATEAPRAHQPRCPALPALPPPLLSVPVPRAARCCRLMGPAW
jgi:hypothetical protein